MGMASSGRALRSLAGTAQAVVVSRRHRIADRVGGVDAILSAAETRRRAVAEAVVSLIRDADLLRGVADERIGLIKRRVMRRIARELGIQAFDFGARRFLAAEHPGVRRTIALD